MKALVVFHGHGAGRLCRYLRWGYRHCFVVSESEGCWVRLDGMNGVIEQRVEAPAAFDLAQHYRREHGFTVLALEVHRRPPSFYRLHLGSCVGLVKAFLSLRAPWVQTPYQLYTYLQRYSLKQAKQETAKDGQHL